MENQQNQTNAAGSGPSSVDQENSRKGPVEDIGLPEDGKNIGGSPVSIDDGGVEGEAKQPKEHTGNMTGMGGENEEAAKRVPDDSEGNSNKLGNR